MLNSLLHGHAPLQLLLFSTLSPLVLARVPITPLSYSTFDSSFNLYPLSGNGGCNRPTPNGRPMMQPTLKSLGGVSAIAQTLVQNLPSYPTQQEIRGLLFLFFGITFQANHQLNPATDNVNAYNNIINTFGMVNRVFTNPATNPYNLKPRYRCLEDYAVYYTHMTNSNGQQDFSLPLIGEYFDSVTEYGLTRPPPYNDIWPGLMFVNNQLDGTFSWYMPNPASPSKGTCNFDVAQQLLATTAFTDAKYSTEGLLPGAAQTGVQDTARALYGITVCPSHFDVPTLLDLGAPTPNAGTSEVYKFQRSADLEDLHELIHLVTNGVVIDQPQIVPPASNPPSTDDYFTNRDWPSWTFSTLYQSYGYFFTAFLGLTRPEQARLNADNWAIFGMCVYFPELDCLGSFQDDIRTRRSVPGGLSPRAVEKIREGGFDLTRDTPMDLDLERGPGGRRRRAEDFDLGLAEKGESRFRDADVPSAIFG